MKFTCNIEPCEGLPPIYDCNRGGLLALDCVKAYYSYSVVIEICVNIELCQDSLHVSICIETL